MAASKEWRDMPLEEILSNGNISWTGEEILCHLAEAGYLVIAPGPKMPDGFAEIVAKEAYRILQDNVVYGVRNQALIERLSAESSTA